MILTELHFNWGKELGPLCRKNLGYYFDLNTWFRSSVSCGSPTGMDTISPFGLFYLTEVYLWASIRSWICFVTYDIHRSNNKEFHRFNHQGTTSPSTGQQRKEEENSFKNERKTTFAMNLSPYFEKIEELQANLSSLYAEAVRISECMIVCLFQLFFLFFLFWLVFFCFCFFFRPLLYPNQKSPFPSPSLIFKNSSLGKSVFRCLLLISCAVTWWSNTFSLACLRF